MQSGACLTWGMFEFYGHLVLIEFLLVSSSYLFNVVRIVSYALIGYRC